MTPTTLLAPEVILVLFDHGYSQQPECTSAIMIAAEKPKCRDSLTLAKELCVAVNANAAVFVSTYRCTSTRACAQQGMRARMRAYAKTHTSTHTHTHGHSHMHTLSLSSSCSGFPQVF